MGCTDTDKEQKIDHQEASSISFGEPVNFGSFDRRPLESPILKALLVNHGSTSVRVRWLRLDCGCTQVLDQGPCVMEAGDRKEIRVRLNPSLMVSGNSLYTLKAFVNEHIGATVAVTYTFTPSVKVSMNNLSLQIGSAETRSVSAAIPVKISDKVVLDRLRVQVSDPSVRTEWVRNPSFNNDEAALSLIAERVGKAGWREAELRIVDPVGGGDPLVVMNLQIEELVAIDVVPKLLIVRADQPWTRSVRLRGLPPTLSALSVRSSHPQVRAELVYSDNERSIQITADAGQVGTEGAFVELFDPANPTAALASVEVVVE